MPAKPLLSDSYISSLMKIKYYPTLIFLNSKNKSRDVAIYFSATKGAYRK